MMYRALFLLCLLLVAVAALAQKPAGPKYDLTTETTFKGVVEEVKEVPNSCLGETGVHVILKTESGPIEVQIAPVDFLKFMEVTFAKGDQLQIVGSKVTVADAPLVIARSVTRDNNEVVVRDKKGAPVWTWMKKG